MISLRERLKNWHRYYHWRRARCIFVHVPKAAGTSINHAIYGRTLGHYTITEIQDLFPGLVQRSFVFSVVRDPTDRLLSAYHFAKVGRTRDMGMHNPEQYRIPEFESFDRFVQEWLVRQELATLDFVFRPQCFFVCIDGRIAVDFLARVESIATDMQVVSEKLRRTITVNKLNRGEAGGAVGSRRDIVSSSSRDVIERFYRDDFDLLGYQ